jgi:general secretion pathway protein C
VKWLAAVAGVVVAGGASMLWIDTRDVPEPPQPAAHAVPPARPAPHVVAATAHLSPPLTGVTLHGVLLRGMQSQAILSVDGGPQQAYGVGDVVKPGWSLQAIRDQQVVLANGTTTTAVEVAAARPVAVADQHSATPVAAATSASARAPGFVTGAPAPFDMATASERNRRFLAAVHAKLRASQ